jgi:hypothetical protein
MTFRLGEWVHCRCGCGYTGRVVEQAGGECSVKNTDLVRVYPEDKLGHGAVCEVCGGEKTANVLVTYTHPLFPEVFEDCLCWSCFAVSGIAVKTQGVNITNVKPLDNGQEGTIESTTY